MPLGVLGHCVRRWRNRHFKLRRGFAGGYSYGAAGVSAGVVIASFGLDRRARCYGSLVFLLDSLGVSLGRVDRVSGARAVVFDLGNSRVGVARAARIGVDGVGAAADSDFQFGDSVAGVDGDVTANVATRCIVPGLGFDRRFGENLGVVLLFHGAVISHRDVDLVDRVFAVTRDFRVLGDGSGSKKGDD